MRSNSTHTPSDPVCGRELKAGGQYPSVVYGNNTYHFCSRSCLNRFQQDTKRFVRPDRKGLRGVWTRYLGRVRKATDGKPPCCH